MKEGWPVRPETNQTGRRRAERPAVRRPAPTTVVAVGSGLVLLSAVVVREGVESYVGLACGVLVMAAVLVGLGNRTMLWELKKDLRRVVSPPRTLGAVRAGAPADRSADVGTAGDEDGNGTGAGRGPRTRRAIVVDVVYVADLGSNDGRPSRLYRQVEALLDAGFKVALVDFRYPGTRSPELVQNYLDRVRDHERGWVVTLDDVVSTTLTVVDDAAVAQYVPRAASSITTKMVLLVVNRGPQSLAGLDGGYYSLDDVVDRLSVAFDREPTLVPEDAQTRSVVDGAGRSWCTDVWPYGAGSFDRDALLDQVERLCRTCRLEDGTQVHEGKYVLRRTTGGLTDMLSQMQKSYQYASAHGRRLFVDSSRAGFHDELSRYFTAPPIVTLDSMPGGLWIALGKLPGVLNGQPADFPVHWLRDGDGRGMFVLQGTAEEVAFDTTTVHGEDLLVHSGDGSREWHRVWEWLRLRDDVREAVCAEVDRIGQYDAVHVRNTDYRTDYLQFFERIDPLLGERIVLCTDDPRCREHAADLWGSRVVATEYVENATEKPLYYRDDLDEETRRRVNRLTLTDLFLLASAQDLHVSRLAAGSGSMSAYSRLAVYLHDHQDVLHQILGRPPCGGPDRERPARTTV